MIADDKVYKIGTLTRVHGLKGELSFSFSDDAWDRVEAEYLILKVDGILVPFFLDEYRFRSDSVALLKFLDIENADDAQELVGCEVYFPLELVPEEAPDELRWSHFTGFKVRVIEASVKQQDSQDEGQQDDENSIGIISAVDDSTQNVLFYIDTQQGEVIVPAVEEFILDVDYSNRTVTMQLPDGLLDVN